MFSGALPCLGIPAKASELSTMTPESSPGANKKVSKCPYQPPLPLLPNFHEMTKKKRKGELVKIIFLVGSAVFMVRGDLPLKSTSGEVLKIQT